MRKRELDNDFMDALTGGHLKPLLQAVQQDCDLILEIRENYINIYFKGYNLLKLAKSHKAHYKISLAEKFRIPEIAGITTINPASDDTEKFVKAIPLIKQRIISRTPGKSHSLSELECEQLLIRFNNNENLSTEYFIIDRQITEPSSGCRFDLAGIFWSRDHRRCNQTVPLTLIEIKLGQNRDISQLGRQLERYQESLKDGFAKTIETAQKLLRQKAELGLFSNQPDNRIKALKTLRVSEDIHDVHYVIVLTDDDPKSRLFTNAQSGLTDFVSRLHIFHVGFGLWEKRDILLENRSSC